MRNQRLEQALADAHLTRDQVAAACEIGTKTVERWITQGRVPQPRHRYVVADLTGVAAQELWPDTSPDAEIIEFYPHRAAVPAQTWLDCLRSATQHIDVLAWAATFYHQAQPRVGSLLADAAARGTQVRLCFADPASAQVHTRELEEPLLGPGVLAQKIRVSLGYYRDLIDTLGVEIRLHRAVVYASLFRYDDQIIVNPHVYGRPASENPALHFQQGTTFAAYTASFDVVWQAATTWKGEQV